MDKAALRATLAAHRPDPATSRSVADGLFRWMSGRLPGTALAYLAMRDEIDVEPLFTRLPGWRWLLPRVEDDGSVTLRDRDLSRENHRWGMAQPVAAGAVVGMLEVDLMLVPGVGFDLGGARIGRGGGHYDRLLAERRSDCAAIGVTWTARIVDIVPMEAHDLRVDYLAVDTGVIPCSTTRQPPRPGS